jgi:hypothetical protein
VSSRTSRIACVPDGQFWVVVSVVDQLEKSIRPVVEFVEHVGWEVPTTLMTEKRRAPAPP